MGINTFTHCVGAARRVGLPADSKSGTNFQCVGFVNTEMTSNTGALITKGVLLAMVQNKYPK